MTLPDLEPSQTQRIDPKYLQTSLYNLITMIPDVHSTNVYEANNQFLEVIEGRYYDLKTIVKATRPGDAPLPEDVVLERKSSIYELVEGTIHLAANKSENYDMMAFKNIGNKTIGELIGTGDMDYYELAEACASVCGLTINRAELSFRATDKTKFQVHQYLNPLTVSLNFIRKISKINLSAETTLPTRHVAGMMEILGKIAAINQSNT